MSDISIVGIDLKNNLLELVEVKDNVNNTQYVKILTPLDEGTLYLSLDGEKFIPIKKIILDNGSEIDVGDLNAS